LKEVLESASRAKEMIQHLLAFSRQEETKTEVINLVDHIKEAVRFLRSYLPRSVQIKEDYKVESASIMGAPGQMHQILINLGTNAMQAMPGESGTVHQYGHSIIFIQGYDCLP
jgi:two-component system cell cycle sensor histidine kinase/response regulator CckA